MTEDHTLATRLTQLFAVHRVTTRQVAKAINDTAGARVLSKRCLNQLLDGRITEATHEQLELLAGYFGVSTEYFRDSAESRKLAQQYQLLAAISQDAIAHPHARTVSGAVANQAANNQAGSKLENPGEQAGIAELTARWPRMRPGQRAVLVSLARTFTDADRSETQEPGSWHSDTH